MKTKKFIHIIILTIFIVLLYSCGNNVEKKKKTSHTLSSITNKGVVLDKNIKYCKQGEFVIKTKTDIVSESIGNIDEQPMKTIFNVVSVGDTIK